MVITIKLTQFAWNVFDFGKTQNAKYKHRERNSVDIKSVSVLEFLSFVFFLGVIWADRLLNFRII